MKHIKYFKNPKTGLLFEYTDALVKRNDLVPIFDDEEEVDEETDFKCEYCGRSFKNAGGLRLHQQFCKEKPQEEPVQNIKKDVVV